MRFPPGFRWGVATAAYQIEGSVIADGRRASIWDTFSHTPGRTQNGDTGDVACDHYRRWEGDLDLIADLGLTDYRFSIAWPRVYPEGTGRVNARGLDFYQRLVDGLLERGIRPLATLYHWDLPQALEDRGGWRSRATADAYARYADTCFRVLGDRVRDWVTHNEPRVAAFLGHLDGVHAPGLRDLRATLLAAHHLLLSHGLAVQAFRASGRGGEIGITLDMQHLEPATDRDDDLRAVELADQIGHRWFLDPVLRGAYPPDAGALFADGAPGWSEAVGETDLSTIAQPIDFLGVNYYTRRRVRSDPASPLRHGDLSSDARGGLPLTAMGWEVYPEGLRELLLRLHRDHPGLPLLVTENGAAYDDTVDGDGRVRDAQREDYLRGHLEATGEAIAAGADVRGYFVWSLLDNFEWALGYGKRFGIVYVDYPTQRRIRKESSRFVERVASANEV